MKKLTQVLLISAFALTVAAFCGMGEMSAALSHVADSRSQKYLLSAEDAAFACGLYYGMQFTQDRNGKLVIRKDAPADLKEAMEPLGCAKYVVNLVGARVK